jgi:hypothetical protein
MNLIRKDQPFAVFFMVMAAISWGYVIARAFTVQLSIDEAATYFMYIQPGTIFPPNAPVDANNHLLNSLLARILYLIFGNHPFILRLPNVIAYGVYLWFILRIAFLMRAAVLRYGFVIIALGIHFLTEFFSYARGYGLSTALLTGSVFYLISFNTSLKIRDMALAVLLVLLATLANLNLIFTAMTIPCWILAVIIIQKKQFPKKKFGAIILFLIITALPALAFFIHSALKIRTAAGFYYGSADGFFPVTVQSLAGMITGFDTPLAGLFLLLVPALLTTVALSSSILRKKSERTPFVPLSVLVLLLANWAGTLILNRFLNVNFQEDRAAMHLVPIYIIFIFLISSELHAYYRMILIPLFWLPVFSVNNISLSRSVYGTAQQVPQGQFDYILRSTANSTFPPIVSAYQIKRQPWAFLNLRSGGLLGTVYASSFPSVAADFILTQDSLPKAIGSKFIPVMTDDRTRTVLFERKIELRTEPIGKFTMDTIISGHFRYNDIAWFDARDLAGQSVKIEMEFNLSSPAKVLEGGFVAEIFDSLRTNLGYEAIDIDQIRPHWGKENGRFRHQIVLERIPPGADRILVYFWNKRSREILISGGTVRLSRILE